jgi:diguanylate cyclase (GGDEF)-like protein
VHVCKRLFLAIVLAVFVVVVQTRAGAEVPMRVLVEPAAAEGTVAVYRLRVVSEGSSVFASIPIDVHRAELVVNGTIVDLAGRDTVIGVRPFGHALQALQLRNLTPRDRVEIRESGLGPAPAIVTNPDRSAAVAAAWLESGLYYGVLLSIVLFLIVAAAATRDPTIYWWFIAWVIMQLVIELLRDNLLPFDETTSERVLDAINSLAQLSTVGFVVTYLKLRAQAPKLFWLLLATYLVSTTIPIAVGIVTRAQVPIVAVFIPNAVAVALSIAVALIRRRAGFLPATFLAVGLLGNLFIFLGLPLRIATGIESPVLDLWSPEIGSLFDFLVFSLAVAYRAQFAVAERADIEAALVDAKAAASHDPLTGLLNRRGLEGWIATTKAGDGCVLFIDIDGFKEVNDIGGHAAGDDTLTIVARILLHAVRAQDAVARFGGDEFVVMIAQTESAAVPREIIRRITSAVGFLLPLGPSSDTRIGVSIGCAMLADYTTFAEALKHADADAYRVKADHHARTRSSRRVKGPTTLGA